MNEKKTVFWHIGYPKTATTTLQQHVFPRIDELNYLGWYYLDDKTEKSKRNQMISHFRDASCWFSDLHPYHRGSTTLPEIVRKYYPYEPDDALNILISDEDFISRGLFPQKKGRLIKFTSALKGIAMSKQLTESAGWQARYIVVLRRQTDLLESLFAQAYPELSECLGIQTLEEYVSFIIDEFAKGEPAYLLRYKLLIDQLHALVGEDNLLVLPYEMLAAEPKLFSSKMCSFMKLKNDHAFDVIMQKNENVRMGSKGKLVNQIPLSVRMKKKLIGDVSFGGLGNMLSFMDRLTAKHTQLNSEQKKIITAEFSEGNRQLEYQYPDFEGYDYY